ncbi:MAG: hypothetical protein J2O48_04850 [Solirubrobacterales bacterium]|nr:hypothetical protein [Solirubrobacterales bacterium]
MAEEALPRGLTAPITRISSVIQTHPLTLDVLMGIVIAAASFGALLIQHRLGWLSGTLAVAFCLPLPLRHRNAIAGLAVVMGIALVQWLTSVPQLGDSAVLVFLYCIAQQAAPSKLLIGALLVEAGSLMSAVKWTPGDSLKVWVGLTGLTVAASVSGIVVRQRRELLASLRERAARLEFERDQEGRLAAAAERARIAREMHDIVSHNLTVMIALADGATFAMEASPEQALPALERVSATGRQALVEMRRLLGVLREEPAAEPLEPQPSLARLEELIKQVEAAGIPVTVQVEGNPRALSDGVQLALFRVAQEALTNTLKHADNPSHATLDLRCSEDGHVELNVQDDGRVPVGVTGSAANGQGNGSTHGGRGLPGMRERAAAYDGSLEAGPLPDGGWRVHLELQA